MNSRVRSRGGNTLPSTATTSLAVTSSAGELMTRPLTVTRPCVIHSSASRREGAVRLGYRRELDEAPDDESREQLFHELVGRLYQHGKALNSASHFEI